MAELHHHQPRHLSCPTSHTRRPCVRQRPKPGLYNTKAPALYHSHVDKSSAASQQVSQLLHARDICTTQNIAVFPVGHDHIPFYGTIGLFWLQCVCNSGTKQPSCGNYNSNIVFQPFFYGNSDGHVTLQPCCGINRYVVLQPCCGHNSHATLQPCCGRQNNHMLWSVNELCLCGSQLLPKAPQVALLSLPLCQSQVPWPQRCPSPRP